MYKQIIIITDEVLHIITCQAQEHENYKISITHTYSPYKQATELVNDHLPALPVFLMFSQ